MRSLASHYPQSSEVHAKVILKNGRGRRLIAEFLSELFNEGFNPQFVVVEKRFAIAAKLVETYFDRHFNNAPDCPHDLDNERRKHLANFFTGFPDEILKAFMLAHKKPSRDSLNVVLKALMVECDSRSATRVSTMLGGCLKGLDALSEDEIGSFEQLGAAGASVNVAAFPWFIRQAGQVAASLGSLRGRVIHDRSEEFEKALRFYFEMSKKLGAAGVVGQLQDGRIERIGTTAFDDIHFAESVESLGVQAADALASSVVHCVQRVASSEQVNEQLASSFDELVNRGALHAILSSNCKYSIFDLAEHGIVLRRQPHQ